LITAEALATQWVDQEIKRAVYDDPAAMERRLIPVLLHPVDTSQIPMSVRKLSRTDLTDPTTRRQQYHHLLTSLGITVQPLPDIPILEAEGAGLAVAARRRPVLETGAMPLDSVGLAMSPASQFYQVEGTLAPDVPSYVQRAADVELYQQVRAGKFCYVLTTRQMGKSSLMIRTAERLRAEGTQVATVDLTGIGGDEESVSADQWYYGIADAAVESLVRISKVEGHAASLRASVDQGDAISTLAISPRGSHLVTSAWRSAHKAAMAGRLSVRFRVATRAASGSVGAPAGGCRRCRLHARV
jgi:hypothetical protein